MTILVGMIGSDGIVLAADQMFCHFGFGDTLGDQALGEKLHAFQNLKVAYTHAGDWYSIHVGQQFMESIRAGDFDFSNIWHSIYTIGERIRDDTPNRPNDDDPTRRELLILFYGLETPQLFTVRIEPKKSMRSARKSREFISAELRAIRDGI